MTDSRDTQNPPEGTEQRNTEATVARLSILFFFPLYAVFSLFISSPCSGAKAKWYKGALHCHTTISDGDSTPQEVADWHKNHGYDFIVITDHDKYTDVDALGLNRDRNFLVIPGEEVSANLGSHPIHMNGINTRYLIKPLAGKSVEEVLQKNVHAIRRAGGIAMVNHPYYQGKIVESQLTRIDGFFLLEIHNAMVSTGPEHEMLLDRLTSWGKHVFGVASDDSHYIKTVKNGHWGSPGNAWVMVRAEALTVENILKSLEKGDFYATTGVILSDLQVNDRKYRVAVLPEKDTTYTISFRCGDFAVKQLSVGTSDVYCYSGKEPYIRAKIVSSKGQLCFTQPHLVTLKRRSR